AALLKLVAGEVSQVQRLDELEIGDGIEALGALLGKRLQRELALRHEAAGRRPAALHPQAALTHVGFSAHREEALAARVAQHRLEPPQQGEVISAAHCSYPR